jgi:hypothetical protein
MRSRKEKALRDHGKLKFAVITQRFAAGQEFAGPFRYFATLKPYTVVCVYVLPGSRTTLGKSFLLIESG